MIKTIFFDRDGIINEVVIRGGLTSSPRCLAEFELLPEFEELHRELVPLKLNMFVVSNQPDVSRELLRQEELDDMAALLKARFRFGEILHCVHDDYHLCSCRKPKPGMILSLLEKHALPAGECVMIGDSCKDILAGQAAGVTTIYVRRSYNSDARCKPDYSVSRLLDILSLGIFS